MQIKYRQLEQKWIEEGKTKLPSYFAALGVLNASSHFLALEAKARAEAEKNGRRGLTLAETRVKGILEDSVQAFAPELWESFGRRKPQYSVAETEALLGEFKRALPFRTSEVFLASSLFVEEYASALAIFLHEHAHIYGYDGSREFTDALTWLMAAIIRNHEVIEEFETQWMKATKEVRQERKESSKNPRIKVEQRINTMNEEELRTLLKQLPPAQLQSLFRRLD